jgi:hypothetical protein
MPNSGAKRVSEKTDVFFTHPDERHKNVVVLGLEDTEFGVHMTHEVLVGDVV